MLTGQQRPVISLLIHSVAISASLVSSKIWDDRRETMTVALSLKTCKVSFRKGLLMMAARWLSSITRQCEPFCVKFACSTCVSVGLFVIWCPLQTTNYPAGICTDMLWQFWQFWVHNYTGLYSNREVYTRHYGKKLQQISQRWTTKRQRVLCTESDWISLLSSTNTQTHAENKAWLSLVALFSRQLLLYRTSRTS